MSESSNSLAVIVAALGLTISGKYIDAIDASNHQLSRVTACVQEDDRMVPLMTYNPDANCDDVRRGRTQRLDEDSKIVLKRIINPHALGAEVFRNGFLMFMQEGRTCTLASAAAILSDISLRNGGPAIDPFVLTDIVESKKLLSHKIGQEVSSDDDLNIQTHELSQLEGKVPFNEAVTFQMKSIDEGTLFENSNDLYSFIVETLQNPQSYVILTSRVINAKVKIPNHDVVVVGAGKNQETGIPYLLVAEPNGALFKGESSFDAVYDDWEPVIPGRFTTIIPLNSKTMELMRRLTIITAIPAHAESDYKVQAAALNPLE